MTNTMEVAVLEPVQADPEVLTLLGIETPKVEVEEPKAPAKKPGAKRGPGGKFLPKAPVETTVIVEEPTAILTGHAPTEEPLDLTGDDTPTLPILNAVNRLMRDIRQKFPEVPPVVVVVGSKGAKRGGQVHGHFAPGSWEDNEKNSLHEIMLSGESLARGAEATLGTLIHEAAHALAHVRGVQDTSNNHRYHNKRFKEIAEGMGIELESAPTLGWSLTTLPDTTAGEYKEGLDALREALTTYRKPVLSAGAAKKPRKSTKIKIDCDCNNEVTVSKIWFEEHGEINCGDCLTTFRQVD